MNAPRISCWLIGADSLLLECGDILLANGHEVRGVVSGAPRIAQWALARGLPAVDARGNFEAELALRPFDYLFAITHLSILPGTVLGLPSRGAINFHDGPLPDYAGLNAPAWALLNREPRYGITWHAITQEVDAGAILKQKLFDLAPDETALSLNTKCFAAAIESFSDLLPELAAGTARGTAQDASRRRYFERHRRPEAAGVIDWTRPAVEIDALVRGLDFGRYENPLGLPKIQRGDRAVAVTSARVEDGDVDAEAQAGTVLACDAESVIVATGRGSISLRGFSELAGQPISPAEASRRLGLSPGVSLDSLDPGRRSRLTELDRRMSRAERFWVGRLSSLEPITLPFSVAASAPGTPAKPTAIAIPLPADLESRFPGRALSEVLTAALAAFLARLSRRASFDLGYLDLSVRREVDGLDSWTASRVPLHVEVRPEESPAALVQRMSADLAEARRRGPWLRDVIARYPELHGMRGMREGDLFPVSVEESAEAQAPHPPPHLPEGAEWTLEVSNESRTCRCVYDAARLGPSEAESMRAGFAAFLQSLDSHPERPIAAHELVSATERERQLVEWNRTGLSGRAPGRTPRRTEVLAESCVHEMFEAQAKRTPNAPAVTCEGRTLTYAELDRRADLLALELRELGVRADQLVGVCVDRSVDLLVSILGVQKAGGAYLPLDPAFPADRIAFMVEDARVGVIVAQERLAKSLLAGGAAQSARIVFVDTDWPRIETRVPRHLERTAAPSNLAYAIYTSGSTGRPKGVLIEHRNVVSFFAAMDERIPHDPPGVWLAVTSLSFDISVLELLWTLTRGFQVVVHTGRDRAKGPSNGRPRSRRTEFSLFYFSSDEANDRGDGYRLLLEGARFADAHGFNAVWTPERHFHAFGGLYPNPAVTGAAVAAITSNVQIRAGSVVLPLHHPARVAEDWSLVDNLSGGRVGVSFASGWQPNDFVLAPQNYREAKDVMFRGVETVRRLWRGEAVEFPGHDGKPVGVRTLPRPVQKELPVWITSAGNIDTYAAAGRIGANVLTHLLGQSVDQLAPKIAAYRAARREAGLDPQTGIVSLMLHTYVGEDESQVRETVREPLERYLGSSMSLIKDYAWAFPAFRRPKGTAGSLEGASDLAGLSPEERAALLAHARERYYETSGLFGTPESCLRMVERLEAIGVDEIACLIDFGVPTEKVLASLPALDRVRKLAQERTGDALATGGSTISEEIRRAGVTHFQCTPSMARMLCSDPETKSALRDVSHLFIGGEAFPGDLARELTAQASGDVTNMYGPTETTIWSTTHAADGASDTVPIGRPISNTRTYVLDQGLKPLPIGAPGELLIGGDGVARGYLRRPELDAERFLDDPFAGIPGARMYRTGDLVRYRSDGVLEFLGRNDHQIKVRGHRIEPGEIEAALTRESGVAQAVVVAREDVPGDQRLVAYLVSDGPTSNSTGPDLESLRERLKARIPEYMLPAHFVVLDRMPQTPNGKIDRRALPAPEHAAPRSSKSPVVPTGDLESSLAGLWQETLGLERVGVEDNFFDIGGHSLLVVRLHRRMQEISPRAVSLTDLFRFPTIRSLAKFLSAPMAQGAPGAIGAPAASLDEASERGRRRRESMERRRQKAGES